MAKIQRSWKIKLRHGRVFVKNTLHRWKNNPEDDFIDWYKIQPITYRKRYCKSFAIVSAILVYSNWR